MLQATEQGGVWNEQQFRGWLAGAGFVDVETGGLDAIDAQLLLARKPRVES
jgi:hypothetical protein